MNETVLCLYTWCIFPWNIISFECFFFAIMFLFRLTIQLLVLVLHYHSLQTNWGWFKSFALIFCQEMLIIMELSARWNIVGNDLIEWYLALCNICLGVNLFSYKSASFLPWWCSIRHSLVEYSTYLLLHYIQLLTLSCLLIVSGNVHNVISNRTEELHYRITVPMD